MIHLILRHRSINSLLINNSSLLNHFSIRSQIDINMCIKRNITFKTSPVATNDKWTTEEDLALQVAVQKYGTAWNKVIMILPEKTHLQCKSRWKTMNKTWRNDTNEYKERKLLGQQKLVGVAMLSNFVICIGKAGAAIYTGSSSLFSESVHSLMDMINQGLLLIGIKRSLRSPSPDHPYGFHKEQYAWAIISAVGILFIGGGLPMYSGISTLLHESPSTLTWEHMQVAYSILAMALVFESYTATNAYRQVSHNARKYGVSIREYIATGSDSSSVQVLLEDSSSVLGSLIAGTSLTASYLLQNPAIDAYGSMSIGALLSFVAVYLLRRNINMVIETAMPVQRVSLVRRIIVTDPLVATVQDIKSTANGPEHARFKAEISFNNEELMRRYMKVKNMKIEDEWSRVKNMKNSEEYKKYLTGFGGGVVEQLGDEIDRIEDNIKDICPEVKHVDLEIL